MNNIVLIYQALKLTIGAFNYIQIHGLYCITPKLTTQFGWLPIFIGSPFKLICSHNDPDGKYNGYYKKEMIKAQITMDYEHNIPLAKKVCGGTESDDPYLEDMLRMTALSARMNMEETWFDS